MNAVALLAAAFVTIAVVGTLAAALHDTVAALLRQRERDLVVGSLDAHVPCATPRAITRCSQERAAMAGAVATSPIQGRLRTSTTAAGRL